MTPDDVGPILLAFVTGAVSASLVWWILPRRHGDGELDGKNSDFTIPSARMTWPWRAIKRQVFPDSKSMNDDQSESMGPVELKEKSGLCIGSIFGMDIGGTLVKCVYFEEGIFDTSSADKSWSSRSADHLPEGMRPTGAEIITMIQQQSQLNMTREYGNHHNSVPLHMLTRDDDDDDDDESPERAASGARDVEHFMNAGAKQALDQFYSFAKRLDTYDMGVKDDCMSFHSRELGGHFHFVRFETAKMGFVTELLRKNKLHTNIRQIGATGGGAHKFSSSWERILGIEMVKQEELASLVAGMQFVLETVVGECYSFRPRERSTSESVETGKANKDLRDDSTSSQQKDPREDGQSDDWWWSRKIPRDVISSTSTYPYLLVTIGTGVSVLRVDGPRKFERISGSTIGGGTYWGLIRLLTDIDDFDTVMTLAEHGDPTKVDMMVGDIYGNNEDALAKLGLPSNIVASSFGKLVAKSQPAAGLTEKDLARALLLMVTNNIGQVAYLNARLHKTERIYFVGNFLRRNRISQRRLAYAINYWSKGEMEALFLEHEGYLGALGAFLLSQGISHGEYRLPKRNSKQHSGNDDMSTMETLRNGFRSSFRL